MTDPIEAVARAILATLDLPEDQFRRPVSDAMARAAIAAYEAALWRHHELPVICFGAPGFNIGDIGVMALPGWNPAPTRVAVITLDRYGRVATVSAQPSLTLPDPPQETQA